MNFSTFLVIIIVAMIVVAIGFVVPFVKMSDIAMPVICVQEGNCVCSDMVVFTDDGRLLPPSMYCKHCSVEWYFWCVVT